MIKYLLHNYWQILPTRSVLHFILQQSEYQAYKIIGIRKSVRSESLPSKEECCVSVFLYGPYMVSINILEMCYGSMNTIDLKI